MSYTVKEIYHTLQCEGFHAGKAAVFLRFSGCNLWSGREADRDQALCQFCDTDFFGTEGERGGKYPTADAVAQACRDCWTTSVTNPDFRPMVVCTGGEPLLQLDEELTHALRRAGFYVAIETNGTRLPPPGIDWICVSPKAGVELLLQEGDELKLVFPQVALQPEQLALLKFSHYYLQPMDGRNVEANTKLAMEFCMANPPWRLSIQEHKRLGIR